MIQYKKTYSLWLRPTQKEIDKITLVISMLAKRYGTLTFPPHVTLLPSLFGDIDTIKEICEKFVGRHGAFDIKLIEVSYSSAYFRNFYILLDKTKELIKLYNDANQHFNKVIDNKFTPHISLLYGRLGINEQKKLKEEYMNYFPTLIRCERVDIYDTSGNETKWFLVDSFELK